MWWWDTFEAAVPALPRLATWGKWSRWALAGTGLLHEVHNNATRSGRKGVKFREKKALRTLVFADKAQIFA